MATLIVSNGPTYLFEETTASQARPLSHLENLPTELIQKIFFYSLDVNFPRASPVLARCVTADFIYRIFLLYAFFYEAESYKVRKQPVSSVITKAFQPAEYRTLNVDERKALQAAVLNCRWCTYTRVRTRLPELLRLFVQSIWTDNDVIMNDHERSRLESFNYEALDRGNAASSAIDPFHGIDNRDKENMTLEIFSTFTVEICKELEDTIAWNRPWRTKQFHPVTCFQFPSKVLHGPWTWEKIRFFHLIRKHRPNLYDENIIPLQEAFFLRQTIQTAIDDAIRSSDLNLLVALLILDKIFHDFISWHYRRNKIQLSYKDYKHSEKHYHVAISQSTRPIKVLQMLIKHHHESLPWWDEELKAWAMNQENSFGQTMLRLMEKLRTHDRHLGRDLAMLMLDRTVDAEHGAELRDYGGATVGDMETNVLELSLESGMSPNRGWTRREWTSQRGGRQ